MKRLGSLAALAAAVCGSVAAALPAPSPAAFIPAPLAPDRAARAQAAAPQPGTAPCIPLSWAGMVAIGQAARPAAAILHDRPAPPPPTDIAAPSRVSAPTPSAPERHAPPAPLSGCTGVPASAVADVSFQGFLDDGATIPPDTMGAVGPNHVVTMINRRVVIQTRAGGFVSTSTLDAFWSGIGTGTFDPRIVFDAISQRWIAIAPANRRTAASKTCLAVSATDDPTGLWNRWAIDADPADIGWADFPGLGVNQTWVAFTENMFTNAGDAFQGPQMWVFDKSVLLAGGAAVFTTFPVGFSNTGIGGGSTLQPAVAMDASAADLFIVDNGWISGVTKLARLSRVSGTAAAPTWAELAGAPFGSGLWALPAGAQHTNALVDAPQLGDARLIETNDSRTLNTVYRGGLVYWAWHSGLPAGGGVADRTGAFWAAFDVAGPFAFSDAGGLDPGVGGHHTFPSIAVNCAGDLCLGFSRLDATRFAEACYAVKPAGQPMSAVKLLKAGESTYYKVFTGTRNRWGDYSATIVDPADDSSFWTIQEYAATRVGPADNDSRWGVWWGRVPACMGPMITQQPDPATACVTGSASFTFAASGTAPLAYEWRKDTAPIDAMANPSAATDTLALTGVSVADAGSYDCVVTNACGSATSDPAALTVCAADFNCSGARTVQDIFDFLGAYFAGCMGQPAPPCNGRSADFNASGSATVQDIFDFLAAYFAGCP